MCTGSLRSAAASPTDTLSETLLARKGSTCLMRLAPAFAASFASATWGWRCHRARANVAAIKRDKVWTTCRWPNCKTTVHLLHQFHLPLSEASPIPMLDPPFCPFIGTYPWPAVYCFAWGSSIPHPSWLRTLSLPFCTYATSHVPSHPWPCRLSLTLAFPCRGLTLLFSSCGAGGMRALSLVLLRGRLAWPGFTKGSAAAHHEVHRIYGAQRKSGSEAGLGDLPGAPDRSWCLDI